MTKSTSSEGQQVLKMYAHAGMLSVQGCRCIMWVALSMYTAAGMWLGRHPRRCVFWLSADYTNYAVCDRRWAGCLSLHWNEPASVMRCFRYMKPENEFAGSGCTFETLQNQDCLGEEAPPLYTVRVIYPGSRRYYGTSWIATQVVAAHTVCHVLLTICAKSTELRHKTS